MKEKTCCFTGHRIIALKDYDRIKQTIERLSEDFILKGVTDFCVGGALGFDTLAAKTILYLKKKYPHIRLILILPCLNHTSKWKNSDIAEYENIRSQCDDIIYASREYTNSCMFKRNRMLVDKSKYCICYLKGSKSGTAYTVKYAKNKGLEIINTANT